MVSLKKSVTVINKYLFIYESNRFLKTHHLYKMNNNHSIQKSIFSFTGNILCTLNNKRHVDGIFRDFPRAFDRVSHDESFKRL